MNYCFIKASQSNKIKSNEFALRSFVNIDPETKVHEFFIVLQKPKQNG